LPTLAKVLRDVGIAASHEIGRLISEPPPKAVSAGNGARPLV
jgi:hypothetical protein